MKRANNWLEIVQGDEKSGSPQPVKSYNVSILAKTKRTRS